MVRHIALLLVSVAAASPALAATPCADLKSLKLSNTTITMAEAVAAGSVRATWTCGWSTTCGGARLRVAGARRPRRR